MDRDLNLKQHVTDVRKKILAAVATIRSWHSCSTNLSQSIERVQNYGMRVILNKPPRTPSALLREQQNWRTLHQRRHTALLCKCMHRCGLNQAPSYLSSKFTRNSVRYSHTQGANKLHLSQPNTEFYRASFEFQGALQYNSLPTLSQPN